MDIDKIVADPATSYWLKNQLQAIDQRDLVDQINDTEILLEALKQRFENMANTTADRP